MPSDTKPEIPRGAHRAAEKLCGPRIWNALPEQGQRDMAEHVYRESGLAEARDKIRRIVWAAECGRGPNADTHVRGACEAINTYCHEALKAIDGEASDARD